MKCLLANQSFTIKISKSKPALTSPVTYKLNTTDRRVWISAAEGLSTQTDNQPSLATRNPLRGIADIAGFYTYQLRVASVVILQAWWMVVCSIQSLALAFTLKAVFVCEGARVRVRICAFVSVRSSCASVLKAERQAWWLMLHVKLKLAPPEHCNTLHLTMAMCPEMTAGPQYQ